VAVSSAARDLLCNLETLTAV